MIDCTTPDPNECESMLAIRLEGPLLPARNTRCQGHNV